MKTFIIILSLCISGPAVAGNWNEQELRAKSAEAAMRRACPPMRLETWKDQERRAACEEKFKLNYYNSSSSDNNSSSAKDPGPCMGDCGSEQGICISNCNGNGSCVGNCASSHGRCVARCSQ